MPKNVNTEVAGPATNPKFQTVSSGTVPRMAPLGNSIKSSNTPPKIRPIELVALRANALAEKITPSLLSPISSSCSSVISANIEFKVANKIGPRKAVIPELNIRIPNKMVEPRSGNQLTSDKARTIGILIYPLIKIYLSKTITEVLKDLKYFAENDTPSPEKIASQKK